MTNNDLLQAMGRIDPILIADAAPDAEQKKSANKTWVKWALLAACFCLAVAICTSYFIRDPIRDTPSISYPGYTAASSFYYDGDVCENEIASITHKGFDDTSITLSIDKKTNDTLVFAFRGWNSPNSEVIVSNASDLILYVNGKEADQIPIAPGKYEVKIDYGNFISKCDELDVMMYISEIGYFSLNNEGYKVNGIDGLPDLTMPE